MLLFMSLFPLYVNSTPDDICTDKLESCLIEKEARDFLDILSLDACLHRPGAPVQTSAADWEVCTLPAGEGKVPQKGLKYIGKESLKVFFVYKYKFTTNALYQAGTIVGKLTGVWTLRGYRSVYKYVSEHSEAEDWNETYLVPTKRPVAKKVQNIYLSFVSALILFIQEFFLDCRRAHNHFRYMNFSHNPNMVLQLGFIGRDDILAFIVRVAPGNELRSGDLATAYYPWTVRTQQSYSPQDSTLVCHW